MSRNYVLTDAAEADMRSIIRYTRKQWGDAQYAITSKNWKRALPVLLLVMEPLRIWAKSGRNCTWRIVNIIMSSVCCEKGSLRW